MRVLLAGATGAIGRPLVRQLLDAGHQVTAITRSPQKLSSLRECGAEAQQCDVFDLDRLTEVTAAARPEAVIGQLTSLPAEFSPRDMERAYAANDRVRGHGTRNLLEAARAAGARRAVVQSIAFFYDPDRSGPADESEPLWPNAPAPLDRSIATLLEADNAVLNAAGLDGVVLRYGVFYGPGTWYSRDSSMAREVRRRRMPIVGRGAGVSSFVHVEDAAAATVAALSAPPGIYNIVDDEPLSQREWMALFARAVDGAPPRRVPVWLARLFVGKTAIAFVTRTRAASGTRARTELGWTPRYPTVREGFSAL